LGNCLNSIDAACMQLQVSRPPADLLSELAGFVHLTTLVFELPLRVESHLGWPTGSEEVLSLATGFMNANPMLRRVAPVASGTWMKGRWPCYVRASDSHGKSIAVFEGFDIPGPDSYGDF
jgi:hypothetical protein